MLAQLKNHQRHVFVAADVQQTNHRVREVGTAELGVGFVCQSHSLLIFAEIMDDGSLDGAVRWHSTLQSWQIWAPEPVGGERPQMADCGYP